MPPIEYHSDKVWNLKWSSDGRILASSGADSKINLFLFDKEYKNSLTLLQCLDSNHSNRTIRRVCFSLDASLIASAGFDSMVNVYKKSLDDSLYEWESCLEGHENEVKSVVFNCNDTLLATCSRDKSVWIWEWEGGIDFRVAAVLTDHQADVKQCLFHPSIENLLVSASYDNSIKVYTCSEDDDSEWYCVQSFSTPDTIWDLSFDSDGIALIGSCENGSILLFHFDEHSNSFSPVDIFNDLHSGPIYSCQIVPWDSNLFVTSGADHFVRVFKMSQNQSPILLNTWKFDCDVNTVAVHPTQHVIAIGTDNGQIFIQNLS